MSRHKEKRLLDEVRDVMRLKHYSIVVFIEPQSREGRKVFIESEPR